MLVPPEPLEGPPSPGPFPVLERLSGAGAFGDPDAVFEFGLARLLDGVAALVAERGTGG